MIASFDVVEIIAAMALASDSLANHCTFHAWRVALLSTKIAELCFPERKAEVFYAGLLHDIGAIALDKPIVYYPTPREQIGNEVLREHPIKGAQIVSNIPGLKKASHFVLYHHEWYDGSGYPFGLKGEEIPFGAQIIRLSDSLDVMCRYFKKDVTRDMSFLVGREFGSLVWEAFLEVLGNRIFFEDFMRDEVLPEIFREVETGLPPVALPSGRKAIQSSIQVFGEIVDARHQYTAGHSRRVAKYTRLILKELSFSKREIDRAYWSALLHDIGKVAIPKEVLDKPGKLTPEETSEVKRHPLVSTKILERVTFLKSLLPAVFHHHERYDGKGYPVGLKGERIPSIARAMAVADAFDAMTSDRPYRVPISPKEALKEIWRNSGTQFDPEFVKAASKALAG